MNATTNIVCPLAIDALCFQSSLTISDWAAWAQAVGTVAAVVAAIFVVWWQLQHEQQRATEKEAQRMFTLWTLIYHARASLTHMNATFKVNRDGFHIPDDLRTNLTMLEGVPLFDMPDDNAAVAIAAAIGAYKAFAGGVEKRPSTFGDTELARRREGHINALEANLKFTEMLLRREVERRGWAKKIPDKDYRMNEVNYPPLPPAR